jgi:Capsule assembly protein Wzi
MGYNPPRENLIGSWIGGQAQGVRAWATYWFDPRSKLQFNCRHQKVSREFIPDDGALTSESAAIGCIRLRSFRLGAARGLAVSRDSAQRFQKRDGCLGDYLRAA